METSECTLLKLDWMTSKCNIHRMDHHIDLLQITEPDSSSLGYVLRGTHILQQEEDFIARTLNYRRTREKPWIYFHDWNVSHYLGYPNLPQSYSVMPSSTGTAGRTLLTILNNAHSCLPARGCGRKLPQTQKLLHACVCCTHWLCQRFGGGAKMCKLNVNSTTLSGDIGPGWMPISLKWRRRTRLSYKLLLAKGCLQPWNMYWTCTAK